MAEKEVALDSAAPNSPTENMDLETANTTAENSDKHDRDMEEEEIEDGNASKKPKLEKSMEEERLERSAQLGPVSLGPKEFDTSVEMFDYFFKLLHHWPPNVNLNKYEHMVLLDLLKKGHPEPNKKIGVGIQAFQVRNHPEWESICFFIVRDDETIEDFSFRKCVHNILPLPEDMISKPESNKVFGRGGGRGRGGRGGWRGRGRGRGRSGK